MFAQITKTQYKLMLGGLIADEYTDVRSYADSREWSKNLTSRPQIDHHEGNIFPALPTAIDPFQRHGDIEAASPIHGMYQYIGPSYIHLFLNDNARVEAIDGGLLRMTSAPSGASHVAYFILDPKKNFTPVACGFVPGKPDDSQLSLKTELRDFKQINGIWIPMESETWSRSPNNGSQIRTVSRLKKIDLNIPLSDQQTDIAFPVGTKINDRIAGLSYTIGAVPAVVADPSLIDNLYEMAESDSPMTVPVAETAPSEEAMKRNLASVPKNAYLERIKRLRPTRLTYTLFVAASAAGLLLTFWRRASTRKKQRDQQP